MAQRRQDGAAVSTYGIGFRTGRKRPAPPHNIVASATSFIVGRRHNNIAMETGPCHCLYISNCISYMPLYG